MVALFLCWSSVFNDIRCSVFYIITVFSWCSYQQTTHTCLITSFFVEILSAHGYPVANSHMSDKAWWSRAGVSGDR